jgi:hypothetical protein
MGGEESAKDVFSSIAVKKTGNSYGASKVSNSNT